MDLVDLQELETTLSFSNSEEPSATVRTKNTKSVRSKETHVPPFFAIGNIQVIVRDTSISDVDYPAAADFCDFFGRRQGQAFFLPKTAQ